MADKVNKEESIARVYQFLNKQKDWKTAADKMGNGNGTVIKTEFRAYLLTSGFKFNNGENKEDLIDAFWKSIDVNTKGKVSSGSGTSNKNALDSKELENIEKTLEATKKVISFMQSKDAPSGLDEQYRTSWKNSVKQGLIYRASEQIKSGGEITDEWMNEAFRLSSAKATADYTATAMIKSELGNIDGYAVGDDKDLKAVIEEYISELDGSTKDSSTIISEIKELISAYVDTAKTNSAGSVNKLAEYGYDPDGYLNDLQSAVLVNDLSNKIVEHIKSTNPEIYTDAYKDQVDAAVKAYIKDYISDKSASDFNTLKSFDVSVFINSDEYKTLVNDIKTAQKSLEDARNALNTYVKEQLAKNDTEINNIVKEVIGTTNDSEVMNKLLELKTVEDVKAKESELKSKIDALNATREANKQAKMEAASKPFDLSANKGKYTGHISENGDRFTPLTTKSLDDLYNNNTVIDLMDVDDMQHCSFDVAKTTSITNLNKFLDSTVTALSANYDTVALSKAKAKVADLYTKAIEHAKDFVTGKEQDTRTSRFEYSGEAYEYQAANYFYNDNAVNTEYSSKCSASNNQLGLRVCYEYDDVEYKVLVNAKCVIDLLQKFYQEALLGV